MNDAKKQWEIACEFSDDETGLCMQVRKLPLLFPKYSINVGVRVADGSFKPFYHPKYRIDDDTVRFLKMPGEKLGRLFNEANAYICEQMNANLNRTE